MKKRTVQYLAVFLLLGILLTLLAGCHAGRNPSDDNGSSEESRVPGSSEPSGELPISTEEESGTGTPLSALEEIMNFTYASPAASTQSCHPDFTEKQKKLQKTKGIDIMGRITAAAKDLSQSSITIPAGDYGFDMSKMINGVASGFYLQNLERPDDNPFTVYCEGVRFWVEPTGEACASCARAFHLMNCSNITFVGLTVAEYSGNDIEGYVTAIDQVNNRIAIQLSTSSMKLDEEIIGKALKGTQCRILAFKPNGDLNAPIYKINASWGPGSALVSNIEPTGKNEDEYYLTFKQNTLLPTVASNEWKSTYKEAGMIEIGDGIGLMYATVLFSVDNCKQITFDRVNNFVTKGMIAENGGYGGHVWKDCVFGSFPGTSKMVGAGEFMFQGTRHGTTFDHVTILSASDDEINIHTFWSEVASCNGTVCRINYAPVGIQKDDIAEFYDKEGNLVATRVVAKTPEAVYNYGGFLNSNIEFDSAPPSNYKDLLIHWPSSSCDGFTIKNSNFINNYQRILIQSGSGVFENNKFFNMGYAVTMVSNTYDYEGAFLGDITFKDNVFANSGNCPNTSMFYISQTEELGNNLLSGKIVLENNVLIRCGKLLDAGNASSIVMKNNTVIGSYLYGQKSRINEGYFIARTENVSEKVFDNNRYYLSEDRAGNGVLTIREDLENQLYLYIRYSEEEAADIVAKVQAALSE